MDLRNVEFEVPAQRAFAVQLKLTPALLEALQSGAPASIAFGDGPADNVRVAVGVG